MSKTKMMLTVFLSLFIHGLVFAAEPNGDDLRQTVEETERAFADTMAQRDFEKFKTFLAEEAVFFSGEAVLRGKQQIADAWEAYFKEPQAPFSWEPKSVEVLESGALAWSTGPVYDPEGKEVATFNSVWRLDAAHQWRIVFDKGNTVCNCP
ncbi:MAG: nuclear transport factor 2 family protein [Xanthomonadales bacterium]|nr:nuclear transport factor 2 family protein [Xanthomonadales bacterium]MDH4021015.1 nuclear transport factor 2 family protein [Xanthomonadales bacterium]